MAHGELMMADTTKAQGSDGELARLALDAALEAERRLREPDYRVDAIDHFIAALQAIPALSEQDSYRSSLSPSETHAFNRAVKDSIGKEAVSFADLMKDMNEVIGEIAISVRRGDKPALEKFLAFCLVLNEELSVRRRAIEAERRPRAKYRV